MSVLAVLLDIKYHLELSQTVPNVKVMAPSMLSALDHRFAKLLNSAAEGFDPLAAAACYADPAVSAVLVAPNFQGILTAARAFLFSQCSGLSAHFAEPDSSGQSSSSSSDGAGSSQTVDLVEPLQIPAATTLQFSSPFSNCWCYSETELSNFGAELCSGTVVN